jgi:hypothetical protein
MLVAIMRHMNGFACVWRLITWEGIGAFPVLQMTRDGIRKRLLHANMKGLQELLTRVSAALFTWTNAYQDQNLAPFATEVFALDPHHFRCRSQAVSRCPRGRQRQSALDGG